MNEMDIERGRWKARVMLDRHQHAIPDAAKWPIMRFLKETKAPGSQPSENTLRAFKRAYADHWDYAEVEVLE